MSYDPRRQRVVAIKQMIRQNPFIANKNSMIKPLYDELLRVEQELEAARAEIAELKKPKKAAPKKKEQNDGDASAE